MCPRKSERYCALHQPLGPFGATKKKRRPLALRQKSLSPLRGPPCGNIKCPKGAYIDWLKAPPPPPPFVVSAIYAQRAQRGRSSIYAQRGPKGATKRFILQYMPKGPSGSEARIAKNTFSPLAYIAGPEGNRSRPSLFWGNIKLCPSLSLSKRLKVKKAGSLGPAGARLRAF